MSSSNSVFQSKEIVNKNATLAHDDEAKNMETVHDDHEYMKVLAENFQGEHKSFSNPSKSINDNQFGEGQEKQKEAIDKVHDMETVHDEHEYIKVLSEKFQYSNVEKGSDHNFQKTFTDFPKTGAEHKI